jgi:MFS family permease
VKRKQHLALICVSLGWFLVLSGRLSISTLLIDIEKSLNIGHTEAGIALSGLWLFYGLMQFPSGIISDLKGRKISILLAMIVFSFSYFFIGLSVHYIMFLISLILVGIGCGSYPTVGIAMLTDIFKEKKGKALGVQSSAGSLAGIAPILAPIIAIYNWRMFFFMWASISFVSTYLFYRCTWESTQLPKVFSWKERFFDGINVLREKKLSIIFIVNLALASVWIGYMSFFPTYLIEVKLMSEIQAGFIFGILMFGGIILKPFIGSLSDKYNKKYIILILLIIAIIATISLILSKSIWEIIIVTLLISFTGGSFLVFSAFITEKLEEKGRGGKLGFYRSLIILLGSPTAAFIGITASIYSFDISFLGISFFLLIVTILLFLDILYQKKSIT